VNPRQCCGFLEALFLAFTNNGFLYAVIRTLAAVRAFVGINHILLLAFTDGSRLADVRAASTSNTIIRYFMRHIVLLLRLWLFWSHGCAPAFLYVSATTSLISGRRPISLLIIFPLFPVILSTEQKDMFHALLLDNQSRRLRS
jgi:hypothetical protein